MVPEATCLENAVVSECRISYSCVYACNIVDYEIVRISTLVRKSGWDSFTSLRMSDEQKVHGVVLVPENF